MALAYSMFYPNICLEGQEKHEKSQWDNRGAAEVRSEHLPSMFLERYQYADPVGWMNEEKSVGTSSSHVVCSSLRRHCLRKNWTV
jgi:hypothetical protein